MTTIDDDLMVEFSAIANDTGCELVHAEFKGGALRVFIERPDGGVTIDDCQTVSKQLSALLDVHDFGRKRYVLEVSSPGLDRQLYSPRDYRRFVGHLVKVTFFEDTEDAGRRQKRTVVGRLEQALPPLATEESAPADDLEAGETGESETQADVEEIMLREGDELVRIALPDIKVARLEIEL